MRRRLAGALDAVTGLLFGALVVGLATVLLPPVDERTEIISVVDGDTVDHDGERWRLVGFDTPEIYHARCPDERHRGLKAAADLLCLLERETGPRLVDAAATRRHDRYGRRLGRISLTDGRDVGALMIAAGHAVAHDGRGERPDWCTLKRPPPTRLCRE